MIYINDLNLKLIVVFVLLSTVGSMANAEPLTPESLTPQLLTYIYKYKEMAALLTTVRDLKKLPEVQAFDEKTSLSGLSVDAEITEVFEKARKAFFENEIVDLALCLDCHFRADFGSSRIFFNMESVLKLKSRYRDWKDILTYIFAHETSHFVQYMSCHAPYSMQNGTSLNGISFPCIEPIFSSEKVADATRQFLHFHAETDLYATLALNRVGFNSWDSVFLYLEDEAKIYQTTPNGFVIAADFKNRKRAIQNMLKYIQ